jgi:hypothetical protein
MREEATALGTETVRLHVVYMCLRVPNLNTYIVGLGGFCDHFFSIRNLETKTKSWTTARSCMYDMYQVLVVFI